MGLCVCVFFFFSVASRIRSRCLCSQVVLFPVLMLSPMSCTGTLVPIVVRSYLQWHVPWAVKALRIQSQFEDLVSLKVVELACEHAHTEPPRLLRKLALLLATFL